jgi:hypothetical protein
MRAILSGVKELPPETPTFDASIVDTEKTRIEGDTVILMDKKGGRKKVWVDTKGVYPDASPKELEKRCYQNCYFLLVSGSNLYWAMDATEDSYTVVKVDMTTGKVISKEETHGYDIREQKRFGDE